MRAYSNNIGQACTTDQVAVGSGERTAFRWLTPNLERTDYTFADLDRESNRCANAFAMLGFSSGDVLFTFLPKLPEQFFAFLGALKLQLVTGTLFANFGDEALLDRLGDAKAKGVVTKKSLLKKIMRIRSQLPYLKTIIVVDLDDHQVDGVFSYARLLESVGDSYIVLPTKPNTPSVLHYTSGSTGKPKGVLHVHGSLSLQVQTWREVLGIGNDDVYWCTADQGWVTGTSYGIISPWALGVPQIHFGGGYDAEAW